MDGPWDFKWVAEARFEDGLPLQRFLVFCPVGQVRMNFCDPTFVYRAHVHGGCWRDEALEDE